ncbi:MAG: 50S ribosomal protein L17 [Patescibacteria group bacterium]
MRHLKKTKKFKRTPEERKRLWVDLCLALVKHGKIITFTARAKYMRTKMERMITYCKRHKDNEVLALRLLRRYFPEDIAKKIFREIAPKYYEVSGGYTSLHHLSTIYNQKDKSIVTFTEK